MIAALITFVLVVMINVFYTYYLSSVQNNKPLLASTWSVAINFAASIAAINYIDNHYNLIPSCLGSFVGTYIGMKIKPSK
jgi:hypothetical protein